MVLLSKWKMINVLRYFIGMFRPSSWLKRNMAQVASSDSSVLVTLRHGSSVGRRGTRATNCYRSIGALFMQALAPGLFAHVTPAICCIVILTYIEGGRDSLSFNTSVAPAPLSLCSRRECYMYELIGRRNVGVTEYVLC